MRKPGGFHAERVFLLPLVWLGIVLGEVRMGVFCYNCDGGGLDNF